MARTYRSAAFGWSAALTVVVAAVAGLETPATARPARPAPASFVAGAARADVTPPPWSASSDALFVPACAASAEQVAQIWTGRRPFQFEEPYVDTDGDGRYTVGEPYCDADHNHRFEAPYIAGGGGQNHWPTGADGNPIRVQAIVLGANANRVAMAVVDDIGLFNVTMDRIRAAAAALAPDVGTVLVSSTHDESAPDPLGLWGPDTPQSPAAVTSGVDEYYLDFLVERAARAIADADASARPAVLRLAEGHQPGNVLSCFSSYPYIDDQLLPVMQGIAAEGGQVIFTLVNAQTHAETYAFSNSEALHETFSSDWPGPMRDELERLYPGSVGVEMAGVVGSVETPTVYEPETTQVLNVPGEHHDSADPNPNGCSTVYPDVPGATAVGDPQEFLSAYGTSMAHAAAEALAASGHTFTPRAIRVRRGSLCLPVENNLFKAAFAAGLFPDRPAYAEPTCTVGVAVEPPREPPAAPLPADRGDVSVTDPLYVRTNVAALTVGPAQFAYLPGEVFPFAVMRGHLDRRELPFPTDCYDPTTDDYWCGAPLPMTPWLTARMTGRYHFLAGLGEDMIGYLFPPGNFVGDAGVVGQNPWIAYHLNEPNDRDRFGHGHADDDESLGPHAGLAVIEAASGLLGSRPAHPIVPGLFVDGAGALSDSPFPADGFGGAVGVRTVRSDGSTVTYLVGEGPALGWVTFDALADPGTAGTSFSYSVSTAGVRLADGRALLVDVYAGAELLLPPPAPAT